MTSFVVNGHAAQHTSHSPIQGEFPRLALEHIKPAPRASMRVDDSRALRGADSPLAAQAGPERGTRESKTGIDKKGTGHGMLNAGHVRSRWKIACRHIAIKLLSKLPGTRFKSRLFARLFGMTLGDDVGLACNVFLDPYDPSMIEIGNNVIIGYDSKIFVHVFTLDRQRIKPVRIGNNVMIGGFSVIAPGVTIGDGASIAPGTIVSRNVPAGAIAMGNPMQIRKRGDASSA